MAKQYRVGAMTHGINGIFRAMTAVGVGASYRRILTVRGRKTGKSHSTPVDVMDRGEISGWWPPTGRSTG